MSKNTTLLLIIWNVILTALVVWGFMARPGAADAEAGALIDTVFTAATVESAVRDSGALKEARIAFFHMDSLRRDYELIKEKDAHFAAEMRKLESGLQGQQARARQRYQELMEKDHTYSTKAEIEKDEAELQGLVGRLQEMQASGEERMQRMEGEMLKEISKELEDFLTAYNASAGFDYILSIQSGGQIWVGNKGLDITDDLVNGLNARYRAGKTKK